MTTLAPEKAAARPAGEEPEEGAVSAEDAVKDTEGITELEKIAPDRVDGVTSPANGFPNLMLKSISDDAPAEGKAAKNGDGDTDDEETGDAEGVTDDDGGAEADAGAAKAAEPPPEAVEQARGEYEAARRAYEDTEPTVKGALDATDLLHARTQWNKWNQLGKSEGLDGTPEGRAAWVAKRAAEITAGAALPHLAEELIKAEEKAYKRTFTAEQRREAAAAGHALSDGSYPIENAEDLKNAAHLAQSGHGNVSGAKRLIRRRAKELGAPNPLDSKGDGDGNASKDTQAEVAAETAPAKSPEAALAALNETLGKAMGAGLISEAALAEILAQVPEAAKGRPLPASTQPAGAHREPDGDTTVEQLEPEAGLPTDHDGTGDKVPSSVDAKGTIPPANAHTDALNITCKAAPYHVQRMHDAVCPAYTDDDVLAAYPALKTVTEAIDPAWFTTEAAAKAAKGKAKKAGKLVRLAKQAQHLAAISPAAAADARAGLRKEFTGAYPTLNLRPGPGIAPASYHRGYLTAGHAANSPAVTGHQATVPPPDANHVPEPQQFERGYLTAGHAAPSPADHGPNNPHPPGSSGHDYYSTSEQGMARAAQASIHDHIAATFAGSCPMAPSRQALPHGLGMGATNTPEKKVPMNMGGISTVKSEDAPVTLETVEEAIRNLQQSLDAAKATAGSDTDDGDGGGKPFGGNQAPPFGKKKKGGKGKGSMSKTELLTALKQASEAGAAAALAAMKDTGTGETVQAVVAEQLRSLGERYDSQLSTLTKQVAELGSQPDPALAPVRGQMSRPETATPVERRSLVDEAREKQAAKAVQDRAAFVDYLRMQAESPDPKVRSRAEEVLRAMPAP